MLNQIKPVSYYLPPTCEVPVHPQLSTKNGGGQKISKNLNEEILTNFHKATQEDKGSTETVERAESIKAASDVGRESEPEPTALEAPQKPIIDRKIKKIERNYTQKGMRKDVIYKSMLRYFKRTLEFNFRKVYDYTKGARKAKSVRKRLMTMNSKVYIKQLLSGEIPSDELVKIFPAIIDTK